MQNKRGQFGDHSYIIVVLAMLVMGAAVFFLFNRIGLDFATGGEDAKQRHAQEIALLLEGVSAVPGNIVVKYPHDLSHKIVKITNKEVLVVKDNVLEPLPGKAGFASSAGQYLAGVFPNPQELYIAKVAGSLVVDVKKPSLYLLQCPLVDTKDVAWQQKRVLLESDIDYLENVDPSFNEAQDYVFLATLQSFSSERYDTDPYVKAYYVMNNDQSIQSQKLGCTLLNEFAKEMDIELIALIPVVPETMLAPSYVNAFLGDERYQKAKKPLLVIETNHGLEPAKTKAAFEKALVRYFT